MKGEQVAAALTLLRRTSSCVRTASSSARALAAASDWRRESRCSSSRRSSASAAMRRATSSRFSALREERSCQLSRELRVWKRDPVTHREALLSASLSWFLVLSSSLRSSSSPSPSQSPRDFFARQSDGISLSAHGPRPRPRPALGPRPWPRPPCCAAAHGSAAPPVGSHTSPADVFTN